jgi:hypothetical protein
MAKRTHASVPPKENGPTKPQTGGAAGPPSRLVAFYSRREIEPSLAALKQLVAKTLSLRGRSVLLQRDLAIALHSLGHDEDALDVVEWPQRSVQYRGKGDAWYAANAAWSVSSRIKRLRGESRDALVDLKRFVDRPAHALLTQPMLWSEARLRDVSRAECARFDDASTREDTLAIDSMAWAVGEHVFFRETAVQPFPHAGFEVRWLDETIEELLERLAVRLRRPG